MGDIGDYWREHKEYAHDRKVADKLGISLNQYRRRMQQEARAMRAEAKAERLARHTLQCECGRTFLDVNAHNSHKTRTGRKGHEGTPIVREVAERQKAGAV